MGEIVNLRRVRKAKARTAKETTAAENRARFGRTGAGKAVERLEAERERRGLDGRRRESPDGPGES